MNTPPFRRALLGAAAALGLGAARPAAAAPAARAGGPGLDAAYPIPYHVPTAAEVAADLERIRGYLETAMPARIADRTTGRPIEDGSPPVRGAVADPGDTGAFSPIKYEVGLLHSGMLEAAAATGDRRFAAFTARQLGFIAAALPYFRAQAARYGVAGNSFRPIFAPASLDDCGAMTAALVQARLAGVGPDLLPVIRGWADYIERRQFRLPDGAFARHRPQAVSVWSDDLYMGVPALVELAKMTGSRKTLDQAAGALLAMASRLYRPSTGLFAHGWNADSPDAPDFYWGRANGWATLAMCDLLDALPAGHPARPRVLALLRAQLRAVASLQSPEGLWHQMLDREDSYLETSASAMFVYGLAHAIDRGWISPATYGDVALLGWIGVSTRIDARGRVQGTCVGTTFAGDAAYYYGRPTSPYAVHGYGAALLAGAETIRLLRNSSVSVAVGRGALLCSPAGAR